MQIDLTPEQNDIVRHAIATGRIARPEDALAQAIADWVERERQRADLITSLDEAEAEHARGGSIPIETAAEARAFFDDIKTRCRNTLAGER